MDFTVVSVNLRIYQHQISCPACNNIISISSGLQNLWQLPGSLRSLLVQCMTRHSSVSILLTPTSTRKHSFCHYYNSLIYHFSSTWHQHTNHSAKILQRNGQCPKQLLSGLCLSRGGDRSMSPPVYGKLGSCSFQQHSKAILDESDAFTV